MAHGATKPKSANDVVDKPTWSVWWLRVAKLGTLLRQLNRWFLLITSTHHSNIGVNSNVT